MPITRSTDLTNSAVTNYRKTYLDLAMQRKETWGQFVDWQEPLPDDGGFGGTQDFPAFGELDPIEDPLTEDADVVPDSITDFNVTVTPREYGRAVAKTQVASFASRVSLQNRLAEMVANDRINSIDRLIRRAACGYGSSAPTMVMQPDGTTTMSNLAAQTSGHRVSWAFLSELRAVAKSMGIEPVDRSGNFVAVVHPMLEYDLLQMTEFINSRYYRDNDTTLFEGEIGLAAGIRFIVSPAGRLHLGAGAATATAGSTTLASAAAAGATSITVASATNIAIGDYLTIGTVETATTSPSANLEQVLVTNVVSNTLTIRGLGNGTSFGLRFDHAAGEAVVETANVAAIPLIGRNSLIGVYGARTGRYGEAIMKDGLDILNRIAYFGWYWYGGVARVEKRIVLGRVATSKWVIGYN